MRMRPFAKLVLVVITFTALAGVFYMVKNNMAPTPDFNKNQTPLTKQQEPAITQSPQMEPPKAQEPTPNKELEAQKSTNTSQSQNTGLNKLIQSGSK